MGCAALLPQYSFTLHHHQGVEICVAGTNVMQRSFLVPKGGTPQDDSGRRRGRGQSVTSRISQANNQVGSPHGFFGR